MFNKLFGKGGSNKQRYPDHLKTEELVEWLTTGDVGKMTIVNEVKKECKNIEIALKNDENNIIPRAIAMLSFSDVKSKKERRENDEYQLFVGQLKVLDSLSTTELSKVKDKILEIQDDKNAESNDILTEVFKKGEHAGKLEVDSVFRDSDWNLDAGIFLAHMVTYINSLSVIRISENDNMVAELEVLALEWKEKMKKAQTENKDVLLKEYNANKWNLDDVDQLKKKIWATKSVDELVLLMATSIVYKSLKLNNNNPSTPNIEYDLAYQPIPNSGGRRKHIIDIVNEKYKSLAEWTKWWPWFVDLLRKKLREYWIILNEFSKDKLKCDISNSLVVKDFLADKDEKKS